MRDLHKKTYYARALANIVFLPALISISAPLLQSTSQININENNLLPKIDFPSLSEVGDGGVVIAANENLKKISLPSLTTTIDFIVQGNPKLKKLCASELKNGGGVCIGNDQPDLDADLSELVTGGFQTVPVCYQDSNVPTRRTTAAITTLRTPTIVLTTKSMLKDDNKPLVAMSTSGTLNRSRRCSLGGWTT
ncbi:hypothetical protein PPROV_000684900 [Pycnococcus provasolii]|uniref:Uncharacterized protein n=1 Tax=Pycnococcus provasolii TaxID=41880 RepID=A0A830HT24_9CHLO|nr:hypothetical protein PPROV_000684900 [Pycnococcus provasolii]